MTKLTKEIPIVMKEIPIPKKTRWKNDRLTSDYIMIVAYGAYYVKGYEVKVCRGPMRFEYWMHNSERIKIG